MSDVYYRLTIFGTLHPSIILQALMQAADVFWGVVFLNLFILDEIDNYNYKNKSEVL